MIVLVMGVTGSGKSTVGSILAQRLGWPFLEADDFHSPANKEKMRRGIHLADADRLPWLEAIHAELQRHAAAGNNVLVACSALNEEYRRVLTANLDVKLVYLKGPKPLIAERLRHRSGHFAGEAILDDQFAVLEEPREAIVVDILPTPAHIVDEVLQELGLASASAQVQKESLLSKLRWRLLPFLFLLYVVAYLDRINVGFAALQMKGQLGFSDSVYGLGAGIFFVGYFFFQVPSNIVLERVGARRWLGTLMILWGAISSSMFLAHSPVSFYTLRFLLGAAEAGFFPGVIYYLRAWFPPSARAGVVAVFMTAGPVSGIIGGPISGALLDWNHRGGFGGWQWMFLIEGIPAILLGISSWFYLANGPEDARWLTRDEKDWLAQSQTQADARVKARQNNSGPAWFASGTLWRFALVYFGLNSCTYSVSLWLPSALQSLSGLPNFLLGVVTMIPYIVAVVFMVFVGMHSDRTGERRWHVALCAFAGAAALISAGVSTKLAVSVAAFGIASAASNSMTGPFWAMASATLAESAAARGIALINALGNLGSGFGPYWIGYLRQATHGFRAGLWSVAFLIALAGFTILSIPAAVRRIPKSPPQAPDELSS
jgi:ACS family tartrate transporter-like MFS transporter